MKNSDKKLLKEAAALDKHFREDAAKQAQKKSSIRSSCDCKFYQGQSCKKCAVHTPGPWKISTRTGIPLIVDARGKEFAQVKTSHIADYENACLMAAAPELLAALKEQHNEHVLCVYNGPDVETALRAHKKNDRTCSSCVAIAKAEGK